MNNAIKTSLVAAASALFLTTASFAQAPAPAKKAAVKAPKPTPELLKKGAAAYGMYCLMCHGPQGHGDGVAGKALKPPPRNFTKDEFKQGVSPEEIFATITGGVKGTPMMAFGHLSETDRWGLTFHVLSMVPEKTKKAAAAKKKAKK